MITENEGFYWLTTEHTAYGFQVLETGHLEHLYYGPIHRHFRKSVRLGSEIRSPMMRHMKICHWKI